MAPGATRDQVVEHLKKGADKEQWELIKRGIVSNWVIKIGE
jgi:hypothetical protein